MSTLLTVLPFLGIGLGAALVLHGALTWLADAATGLVKMARRRWQPRAVSVLRQANQEQAGGAFDLTDRRDVARLLLLLRPTWWALAVLAGLALHDVLRAMVFGAGLVVMGETVRYAYERRRRMRLNEDVATLILQFSSRYPVLRSVRATLEAARDALPDGEAARAVEHTLHRLDIGADDPFAPLAGLSHPVMRRLATVLDRSQKTTVEVFLDALEMLRGEVEDQIDIQRQVRQTLTMMIGTVRVLQVFLAVTMGIAAWLPVWRAYFLANHRWVLMLFLVVLAAAGSMYVEVEIHALEEQGQ